MVLIRTNYVRKRFYKRAKCREVGESGILLISCYRPRFLDFAGVVKLNFGGGGGGARARARGFLIRIWGFSRNARTFGKTAGSGLTAGFIRLRNGRKERLVPWVGEGARGEEGDGETKRERRVATTDTNRKRETMETNWVARGVARDLWTDEDLRHLFVCVYRVFRRRDYEQTPASTCHQLCS